MKHSLGQAGLFECERPDIERWKGLGEGLIPLTGVIGAKNTSMSILNFLQDQFENFQSKVSAEPNKSKSHLACLPAERGLAMYHFIYYQRLAVDTISEELGNQIKQAVKDLIANTPELQEAIRLEALKQVYDKLGVEKKESTNV